MLASFCLIAAFTPTPGFLTMADCMTAPEVRFMAPEVRLTMPPSRFEARFMSTIFLFCESSGLIAGRHLSTLES